MTPVSSGSTPAGSLIAFPSVAVISADRRVSCFPACALIGATIRPPHSPASTNNETPQPRLDPALPVSTLVPISNIVLPPRLSSDFGSFLLSRDSCSLFRFLPSVQDRHPHGAELN